MLMLDAGPVFSSPRDLAAGLRDQRSGTRSCSRLEHARQRPLPRSPAYACRPAQRTLSVPSPAQPGPQHCAPSIFLTKLPITNVLTPTPRHHVLI